MVDSLAPAARSALMARIRGKDTKPERVVRRLLHGMGYRFRLHCRELPGSPDIVFGPRRRVLFVHGCFWHGHAGCRHATVPSTRREFWVAKIAANRARDRRVKAALTRAGWGWCTIWECQTRGLRVAGLSRRLATFLEGGR